MPMKSRPLKRFAILDPLVEETVQRSLSQQNRLSCIVTPTKVHQKPRPSPSPQRNRGERRSLSRFTKELERYCVAASTNGRPPLPPSTPTVSESPTTLDTVVELAPYHKQFKAAGLAVTSREQTHNLPDSRYARLQNLGLQTRYPTMTRSQVDGSTVSPSDQEPSDKEPVGQAAFDQGPQTPPKGDDEARPSMQIAGNGPKSLLPFLRRKDSSKSKTSHSGRKFSRTHIHPSEAVTAEPVVTPLSGIIDSYFDVRKSVVGRNEGSNKSKQSVTAPPSAAHSAEELPLDKPLPKEPPIERRPVPPRKERRHMEDTSQWPTAGVVIHDKVPRLNDADEDVAVVVVEEPAMAPQNDFSSVRSWTTEEEEVSELHEASYLPPEDEEEREIDVPQRIPPVPPKDVSPFEDKSDVPPKCAEDDQPESQGTRCLNFGKSLHNQWHKAAALRHGRHRKYLPKPLIAPQEIQVSRERIEDHAQESDQVQDEAGWENDVPQLPFTWQAAAKSSSSFKKALDAVIQKLDAMEERRIYERKIETEEYRKSLAQSEMPDPLSRATSSKPPSGPPDVAQSQLPESSPSSNNTAEQSDRNISDKDVLLGLKMAICAACDDDLDAWIRNKTGLRLRRFLADLKSFDSVSSDRKAPPTQPLSRQIRRSEGEDRRLQAEKARRRRSTKKAPWAPCFGADGQVSITESSQET